MNELRSWVVKIVKKFDVGFNVSLFVVLLLIIFNVLLLNKRVIRENNFVEGNLRISSDRKLRKQKQND